MAGFPPKKNAAFSWYFVIRDADGDLVAGATALDAEVSIDGGLFADITAAEVDEGQGFYSVALTAAEMNGDVIALICKTSSAGAKSAAQIIYTSTLQISDTLTANPAAGGIVSASFGAGAIDNAAFNVTETLTANPAAGGITAASFGAGAIDAAALANGAIDAATFAAGAIDNAAFNVTETLTANPAAGGITSASFAAGAIDAAAIAAGAIGVSEAPNLDAAISTRATPAQVNTEVVDALNVDTYAEPAQGTPAATATLVTKIGFLYKAWRNRHTQTATQYALYNDDAVTIDHKATVSDDATTFDRTEVATGP